MKCRIIVNLFFLLFVAGCTPRGPLAIFQKLSPHEQYALRLKNAGLNHSGMGMAWLAAGETDPANAVAVQLPSY